MATVENSTSVYILKLGDPTPLEDELPLRQLEVQVFCTFCKVFGVYRLRFQLASTSKVELLSAIGEVEGHSRGNVRLSCDEGYEIGDVISNVAS